LSFYEWRVFAAKLVLKKNQRLDVLKNEYWTHNKALNNQMPFIIKTLKAKFESQAGTTTTTFEAVL
jgi:hypothetical protein